MRFKGRALLSLLVPLTVVSSCGQLGSKKAGEKTILPGKDQGCYDQLGDRVARFFDGSIEAKEWNDSFDCVRDQVAYFKRYVRGSTPEGYNQTDISLLVRQLLITNRPVTDSFIASIFDIKASVFGGRPELIGVEQIDEFVRFSELLRRETTALLPFLQARKKSPSSANMLSLADGLDRFGQNLSRYFLTLRGSTSVNKTSLLPFVREILTMHGGDASLVDRYSDVIRNLKVIIAGGSPDFIEPAAWPTLIADAAAFGGVLLAYHDENAKSFAQSEEQDDFERHLILKTRRLVDRVVSRHGDGIPLGLLDPVIDTFPTDFLTPEKRAALKHDLRPLVFRGLKGGVVEKLNSAAVATVVDLLDQGYRAQIHLKRIYRRLPKKVGPVEFEAAARTDMSSLASSRSRSEVNRLITISKTFMGLFPEDSGEIIFLPGVASARSRNHMIRMSWYKILVDHLLPIYATGPFALDGKRSAKVEDLTSLVTDYLQILQQWKMAYPMVTPVEMAVKRFLEGNIFMPNSNGNAYFENAETTYYFAFLFSSSAFSHRIFREVTTSRKLWSACPITGKDAVGQEAVDASCFRKIYFSHPEIFWPNLPALQHDFQKMTESERLKVAYSMEAAGRLRGYSEDPIGPYDTDSFAAITYYVEEMLQRFDLNHDQLLNKNEILDEAYPVLKMKLSELAGTSNDRILKGILTFIIQYGEVPTSNTQILAWCARMPFINVTADRVAAYNVVALLSGSSPPLPQPEDALAPQQASLWSKVGRMMRAAF